MNKKKNCGILMHITSLPSRYGIGDLGETAHNFVDFLKNSGQQLWQILPLNIPDFTFSPYQSPSAFANNPALISLESLQQSGLLTEDDIIPTKTIDNFQDAYKFKNIALRKAFEQFVINDDYVIFCKKQSVWLDDYALFMALKKHFNDTSWNEWPHKLAIREEKSLEIYRQQLSVDIAYHKFTQYIFNKQWHKLKSYANSNGIEIIGDLPIFIAFDSSDVWANQELFDLDAYSNPRTVAGVPPDYFSHTGQLWGNPHYNWFKMATTDYLWWRIRTENAFKLADIVRIDHFRGFAGYWAVPYGDKTAVNGSWVQGPGRDFFKVLENYFGKLNFIAEDLGVITEDVIQIKNEFNLPGMKILQFDLHITNEHATFNAEYNSIVYTGTHDNNTTVGWYHEELGERRLLLQKIFDTKNPEKMTWELIAIAYASESQSVIVPMQDFLVLDSNARMNLPGSVNNKNWQWQANTKDINTSLSTKIKELVTKHGRI